MLEALISLRDAHVRDILLAALQSQGSFRSSIVSRNQVLTVLADLPSIDVVITDLDPKVSADEDLIKAICAAAPSASLVVVADGNDRAALNKLKLLHDISTVVTTPIDPFDLARRLRRIERQAAKR